MRILQVRFKNLNSLFGEWCIDLTHPVYGADGIFAITGPTGAGKTTLLDAICLSLYGETPRLRSISKSSNEIMSRQAGECFAEVTFETDQGRYRCHWTQHRARRKPGGELQLVKHEISNLNSGQVLETKLTETRKQVQQLTGMAFEQFTRSVLLAQGGFAAFLLAKADERSPLLEQITGTDIYSTLSQKVHQRWSLEKDSLRQIQMKLDGVVLLSEDEEQALQAEQTTLQARTKTLTECCHNTQAKLDWQRKMTELEQQQTDLEQQWQDFLAQAQAQASQLQQLQRANKALPLSAAYRELQQQHREQEKDKIALAALREQIEPQQEILAQAQKAESDAELVLKEAQGAQQREKPILKQVRELDREIESLRKNQRELHAQSETLQQQFSKQQDQVSRHAKTLTEQEKDLAASQAYLTEHACDENLLEQLSGLEHSFDTWTSLAQQFDKLHQASQDTQKVLIEAQQNSAERDHEVRQWRQRIQHSEQIEQDLRKQIEATLEGRQTRVWRTELDTLQTRLQNVLDASKLRHSIQTEQQGINVLTDRLVALEQQQQTLSRQIQSLSVERDRQQQELEQLQEKILLLKRIRDLEQERAHLVDGQPCVLCGALEHPYAHGNIPPLDPAETESKVLKSRLSELNQQLETVRHQAAECGSEVKHAEQDKADRRAQLASDRALITEICNTLGLSVESELQAEQLRIQEAIQKVIERLAQLEQLEGQAQILREQMSDQRAHLAEAENQYLAVQQLTERTRQQQQHLSESSERIQHQQQQLCHRLSTELAEYQLDFSDVASVRRELQQRRDRWRNQQNLSRDLANCINASRADIQAQTALINKLQDDTQSLQDKQADLERQVHKRTQDRAALYADKNPDLEEQRLDAQLAQAQQVLQQARQVHQQAQHEIDISQRDQTRLLAAIEQREEHLLKHQNDFSQGLRAQGFQNEADYGAALLDEAQRQALEQQADTLQGRRAELATRRQDIAKLLETERTKALSEQSIEFLQTELAEHSQALQQAQQRLGAVQERLTLNACQQTRQQERLQQFKVQQREYERWDRLYQLIGSADGKKYRNFAQGLTFEVMVAQANRQLLKMTDRYVLIRDQAKPLELNVIDQYQGGEIRSTKNLSGGESFIVSMALALGLAQMASRNVRVDSLFLDEGFGTLDEDALDTALNALASLRQEGKLIGVISHVAALKERIATQIQLIPESGGRSRLQGPGCTRGSDL